MNKNLRTALLVGSPLIYSQRAAPSHAQSLLSTCYRYARLTLSAPAPSRVIPNITCPLAINFVAKQNKGQTSISV